MASRRSHDSYMYHPIRRTSTTPRSRGKRAASSHSRPSTAYTTTGTERHHIVCAVSESRGISPTVGLAFVNLDTSEGILCQISDTQTYARTITKLAVLCPSVLLLSTTACEPKSRLFAAIEQSFGADIAIFAADRRFWSEKDGLDQIEHLGLLEDIPSLKIAIGDSYYAVCCFAAALKYVEIQEDLQWSYHTLRLKYESSEGCVQIDTATVRSLELIQNAQDVKSKECLFGVLDRTITPMGTRLLRSSVLQPLTDVDESKTRWDGLEELTEKEDLFHSTTSALKSVVVDVDKVLTSIAIVPKTQTMHTTEQAINQVLALKQCINAFGPLHEALSGSRSTALQNVYRRCAPRHLRRASTLINDVINEDTMFAKKPVEFRNQRNYAVKEGHNALLDVARRTFDEAEASLLEYVQALSEEHELALDVKFDLPRQRYLRVLVADLEDRTLPDVFINVFKKGKHVECLTLDLKKMNQRVLDASNECLMMGDRAVQDLIVDLREEVSGLFKISEAIAMLDMLLSFASLAIENRYVRPELGDALALRAARHPIKELHDHTKFVTNDVFAHSTRRFQIVTGCNMSGKSTYIRTAALLCIMAQMGCFVPAEVATVPVVRQIVARVATDDPVEANVSTFSAEMRDVAYILANVDRYSLVVIDELGRGTSTRDGLAIALAISEALISSGALVWFATHFRDLARILAERPGVGSMHLAVNTSRENSMAMLYRVAEGVAREEHCGLMLAKVLPFPDGVIEKAEEVARALQARAEANRRVSDAVITARRRKLVLGLREQMRWAVRGNMSDAVLRDWVVELQKEFVAGMVKIEEDARRESDATSEASGGGMVYEVDHDRRSGTAASGATSGKASSDSMLFELDT